MLPHPSHHPEVMVPIGSENMVLKSQDITKHGRITCQVIVEAYPGYSICKILACPLRGYTAFEPEAVNRVMRELPPDYQAVLSLRYLDDLSVPEVADALGRSVHATESLLVRARRAFRTSYVEQIDG